MERATGRGVSSASAPRFSTTASRSASARRRPRSPGCPAPTCPTGGRPPTSWRSAEDRRRPRLGSTPPSPCSCPWRRPAAAQPRAPDRARPRVWRRGRCRAVGLERGRRRSRPACWTPPTGPPAHRARAAPRAPAQPVAAAAPRVRARAARWPRRGCTSPPTGSYEAEINGARVGDHVLAPGWTSYRHRLRYQTYDVTDLLREGANALGAHRWPTAGTAAGSASPAAQPPSTATGPRCSPSSRSPTPTASPTRRHRRRLARARRPDHSRPTSTTARPSTPGSSCRRLVVGRASTTPAGPPVDVLDHDPAALVAPTGPPVRRTETVRAGGRSPPRRRARRSSTSARTWSAGSASAVRRPGRARRSPCATPRCSRTASCAPGRCARAAPPTRTPCAATAPRTWEPRFTFHGFRYAEVDRLAGRAERRRRHGGRRATPTCARTGWFACSDPLRQPAARERRLGHARQLRRRPDRLPAARRAARLDRRHRRCSRPTAVLPLRQRRASSLLAARPRRRAGRRRRGRRSYVPVRRARLPFPTRRRRPPGATPPWSCPWVLYQRFGDRGLLAAQFAQHARLGRPRRRAGRRRALLWDARLPVRRLARPDRAAGRPGERAHRPDLVATAYLARSARRWSPTRRTCSAASDDAHALRASWPREVAPRFDARVRDPDGRLASDAQTAYALPCEFELLPDRSSARTRRRPARRAGADSAATASAPASSARR